MSVGDPVPEIMRFFDYEHLPDDLQRVSKPFALMARHVEDMFPPSDERAVCLRKILDAKDAAVRCRVLERTERKDG